MAKKTKADLLAEAQELGLELDPDTGYSEILVQVKEAREAPPEPSPAERAALSHEAFQAQAAEQAITEAPVEVAQLPAARRIRGSAQSTRRAYPYDALGRYIGR